MSTRPVRSLAALGAAAAVVLSGCSSALPTDPVPQPGLSVDVQARQDVQRILPRPQPDASQTEIVAGFLRANVGFAEDDDVAREYLTPELASAWVPTSSVVVLEGTPTVTAAEGGSVTVSAQIRGRIDEQGRLTEQPEGTTTSHTFRLEPVAGEWRISSFPEGFGLWLSPQDLDTAFRPYTVYFLNPHLSLFVPDVRWLARGEGLFTSLTRAQLAPVPTYLEGAVETGSDQGVRLAMGAVPVNPDNLVATVNLEGSGLAEDEEQISQLRAQLAHSLLGLSGVTGIDLRVAGRVVGSEAGEPITTATDLGYRDARRSVDQALLRVRERVLPVDATQYDLRNLTPEPEPDLPTIPISWTGVAASQDLSSFAAVSIDGRELWRWSQGREQVNSGIGDRLTDPSYDPHGHLWVAGVSRGSGGTARVWYSDVEDLTSVARPLDVPWIVEGERIREFRVSPDGTRALLVVGREARDETEQVPPSRLLVAGIIRDGSGRPTGLDEPLSVAPTLRSVASARWGTASELVAVGRRAADQFDQPFAVPLGGWLRQMGEQAGVDDIVPIPNGGGYGSVLRTDDGRFHTPAGRSSWEVARNGDELIIPGT